MYSEDNSVPVEKSTPPENAIEPSLLTITDEEVTGTGKVACNV